MEVARLERGFSYALVLCGSYTSQTGNYFVKLATRNSQLKSYAAVLLRF